MICGNAFSLIGQAVVFEIILSGKHSCIFKQGLGIFLDWKRMIEAPLEESQKDCSGNFPSRSEEADSLQHTKSLKKEIESTENKNAGDGIPINCSIKTEREGIFEVCRVCQFAEPDESGEAALKFLGISFPSYASYQQTKRQFHVLDGVITEGGKDKLTGDIALDGQSSTAIHECNCGLQAGLCATSVDSLMELGCACRSDLALAHYACALRWFVSRGSLICEICRAPAVNISIVDRNKVISILKEKDTRQTQQAEVGSGGSASTSREKLSDVITWFDPHGNTVSSLLGSASEQVVDISDEGFVSSVSPATKWAVEGTGILIATGLLTVTITWLLSPRVAKGVARKGLNILLGGLCALSIVVFLRFGILPRIKYGPARYWAILVVFWFLVFGVWASSTRNSRSNT